VTMSNTDSDNTSKQIQISLTSMVKQPLHVALMYEDRFSEVGEQGRMKVVLTYGKDIFIRWTLVVLWNDVT
jgi:hypothetical protein